jgi:hypothetical protein
VKAAPSVTEFDVSPTPGCTDMSDESNVAPSMNVSPTPGCTDMSDESNVAPSMNVSPTHGCTETSDESPGVKEVASSVNVSRKRRTPITYSLTSTRQKRAKKEVDRL